MSQKGFWKEAVVIDVKILFQYLCTDSEKDHENNSWSQ